MGRRVSSGVVGGTGLGSLSVVSSTISSTTTNGDITLDPNGAGLIQLESDTQLKAQADLRFADADSSNYVAIQAPTTIATDYTLTLPSAVSASNGLALVSDTGGVLSWAAAGAALTDNTTDSGTNYLTFTTSTSGNLTAARVATTKLTFQPSTGSMDVGGVVRSLRTENVQTGNYTLALTDRNAVVTMNNTGSAAVTIPDESSVNFPTGSVVYIARVNTGAVTLAAAGGVTVSKVGQFGANEEIYVRKRSSNNWIIFDSPRTRTGSGGTTATDGGSRVHSYTSTGNSTFTVS